MKLFTSLIVASVLMLLQFAQIAQMFRVKFNKLECEEYDTTFATFEKCYLKVQQRSLPVIEIFLLLHQKPVDNITLNAELLQKGQGYRPFMYNTTLDFCRLMKNAKSSLFWKMVFREIIPYSNINHSCPIDHDIIVEGLSLKGSMFQMVPFPVSDYMFRLKFAANKIYRFEIRAYVTLND